MAAPRPSRRCLGVGVRSALAALAIVVAFAPWTKAAATPSDLYDLTRWGLRNARGANSVATLLSGLIDKMSRNEFYNKLDTYRIPRNGTADAARFKSLLNGKDAPGITVLLPNTLGLPKAARLAMLPFLVLAGPPPQEGTNFTQLADPNVTHVSYAPPRNAFFNATYGLQGTWRFAPVGKPFVLRRSCRGARLVVPRERGVRLDSCAKMLSRVNYQVVEYDRPTDKSQHEQLMALRALYKRRPQTVEVSGCTTQTEPTCLDVDDATSLAPGVNSLGRFVGLNGLYGEADMLTSAPMPYVWPQSPSQAGGAGSVALLKFSDPACPGASYYSCLYVPPGMYLDTRSVGESLVSSSTDSEEYYTEVGVSASASAGYGAFEAEVGGSYEATSLESSSYYSVKVYAYQELYSLKLEIFSAAQYLSPTFVADVSDLNANIINATQFVTKYGCFFLTGLFIGGKYRMSTSYSIYTTESSTAAEAQIELEYQDYVASSEFGASQTTSTYDSDATLFWRVVGGDPTQVADYNAWASTVWSSSWVMMNTTNQPLTGDYSGTTNITADNGPMVQAGATQAALDSVAQECIWKSTPAKSSALDIISQECSYTYDSKSDPPGRTGCDYDPDNKGDGSVTTSPAYIDNSETRQNYVTGLCATVNNDLKMEQWGTWLTDIKTGTRTFSAGTNGNTLLNCDAKGNCSQCAEDVRLQSCVQVPPGSAIVGVCITVNADKQQVTGMQLWWAKLQPYANDQGYYREAFDVNRYNVTTDPDGSTHPCDPSSESAKILLDDGVDAKWKNRVITGVTTRYVDANRDYLAVHTGYLNLNTSTVA